MSPLVGVFAAALSVASTTPAPSPDHVRDVARDIVKAPAYQTDLPSDEDGKAGDDQKLDQGGAPAPPESMDSEPEEPVHAGPLAFLMQWLLYILIAAGVAILLFWLVTELMGYQKDEKVEVDGAAPDDGTKDVVEKPLGDAEALAREGKFAEAIHTLLLRTLEELVKNLSAPLPRSLTSREILGRVPLPGEARTALSGLVTATELCWFGDETPGANDYRVCVDHFRAFAAAYTRGMA
jgi:hypothetical protein